MIKQSFGFTLIEVLIALAIVAIAMTAVIKATGDDIRGTTYLKNKTTAYYVGMEVLNEMRAGATVLPQSGEMNTGNTAMLGQDWQWEAKAEPTGNGRIKKIWVNVFSDDNANHALIKLMAYA